MRLDFYKLIIKFKYKNIKYFVNLYLKIDYKRYFLYKILIMLRSYNFLITKLYIT